MCECVYVYTKYEKCRPPWQCYGIVQRVDSTFMVQFPCDSMEGTADIFVVYSVHFQAARKPLKSYSTPPPFFFFSCHFPRPIHLLPHLPTIHSSIVASLQFLIFLTHIAGLSHTVFLAHFFCLFFSQPFISIVRNKNKSASDQSLSN